jgi:hypothetical protein
LNIGKAAQKLDKPLRKGLRHNLGVHRSEPVADRPVEEFLSPSDILSGFRGTMQSIRCRGAPGRKGQVRAGRKGGGVHSSKMEWRRRDRKNIGESSLVGTVSRTTTFIMATRPVQSASRPAYPEQLQRTSEVERPQFGAGTRQL